MRFVSGVSAAAVGLALVATPARGQESVWQGKWYWGGQVGYVGYRTPTQTDLHAAWLVGGHWLITQRKTGLYMGIDEIIFRSFANTGIEGATLDLNRARRIQASVYIFPWETPLQFYAGGGVAIQNINSPQYAFSSDSVILDNSWKAFPVLTLGAQINMFRLSLFGNYTFLPPSGDYMLVGSQYGFTAGMRYALFPAREDVTTRR